MRVMLTAFAVTIVIAFAASAILERSGFSTAEQSASRDVRLD
jgi:hypothetical protein